MAGPFPTKKITQLPLFTAPLTGFEEFECVQAGNSRKVPSRAFVLPTDALLTAVDQGSNLPGSRFLAAGVGIQLDDAGPGDALTISMLGTGALPGNPTTLIGLSPFNGGAATWMRSDAAPALDQGIAPTWTGGHTFTLARTNAIATVLLSAATMALRFNETDAAANNRQWEFQVQGEQFRFGLLDDTGVLQASPILIDRTDGAVDGITFATSGASLTLSTTGITSTVTITAPALNATSATQPIIRFIEQDAPVNEQIYDITSVAGDLLFRTRTDADAAGVTWLTVTRTGTTVNDVTIAVSNALSVAAILFTTGSRFEIENAAPIFQMDETDAPANERSWLIRSVAGDWFLSTATDAAPQTAVNNAIQISRTGTTVDNITFNFGSVFELASATCEFRMRETDAPADEKIWYITAANSVGTLELGVRNDAGAGAVNWGSVTRTGTTIDSITFSGTAIQLTTSVATITAAGTTTLRITDSSAAANEKIWGLVSSAGVFGLQTLTDAGAPTVNAILLDRTGTAVDSITFNATTHTFIGVIAGPTIRALRDSYSPVVWNAGANNLDLNLGNAHRITLQGNVTLSFINPPTSGIAQTFTIFLLQDGTGSRTVTWPASVHWSDGTTPTLTTTANRMDAVTLTTFDGGTTYFGGQVLANMVP